MSGFEVVPTQHGPMIVPVADTYIGRALRENGVYSPEEFAAWRPYLRADSVILDGGANCGGHTAAFARACPTGTVLAVEPQRALASALAGSCALNGWAHVEVRNAALGHHPGTITVPLFHYTVAQNYGAWRIGTGEEVAAERGVDVVPRVTIDALNLTRLDLLKLDVEYHEWNALQGGSATIQRCRPVIVAEFNVTDDGRAMLDWLMAIGYHPWLQIAPYGVQWPDEQSINVLALPTERHLPDPVGVGIEAMA